MSITLLCIKLVTQIFNEMLVFRAVARYKLIAVTALEIRGHIFGKKNYLLVFSMYNTKINQGIGIIILIFFFSQLFLV